jgi:hypothetical protein
MNHHQLMTLGDIHQWASSVSGNDMDLVFVLRVTRDQAIYMVNAGEFKDIIGNPLAKVSPLAIEVLLPEEPKG